MSCHFSLWTPFLSSSSPRSIICCDLSLLISPSQRTHLLLSTLPCGLASSSSYRDRSGSATSMSPTARAAAGGRHFITIAALPISIILFLILALSSVAHSDLIPTRRSASNHHRLLGPRDAYAVQRLPSGKGVGPHVTSLNRPAGAEGRNLPVPGHPGTEVFTWYSKTP